MKKESSAISIFAAESKSALESNQEVSAIERLTSSARVKAKVESEVRAEVEVQDEAVAETSDRLLKAAQAAAVAIGEVQSPGTVSTSDSEVSEIAAEPLIASAAENISETEISQNTQVLHNTETAQSTEESQSAQAVQSTQTETSSDTAEPESDAKEHKRKGIFGFLKSGKQKFKQGTDSYESNPVVARMKN